MKMKEAKIIENMVNVGKIALTVAIASLVAQHEGADPCCFTGDSVMTLS